MGRRINEQVKSSRVRLEIGRRDDHRRLGQYDDVKTEEVETEVNVADDLIRQPYYLHLRSCY